jgi:hypothetical protein
VKRDCVGSKLFASSRCPCSQREPLAPVHRGRIAPVVGERGERPGRAQRARCDVGNPSQV